MTGLDDIRNDNDLMNMIDWDMTPEEAVTLYLEWGNNWSHGKKMIKSKRDVSHYFVIYNWEDPPFIVLVRRNSEEAVELARIEMPEELKDRFQEVVGHNKGVYALNDEVKAWLQNEIFKEDIPESRKSSTMN